MDTKYSFSPPFLFRILNYLWNHVYTIGWPIRLIIRRHIVQWREKHTCLGGKHACHFSCVCLLPLEATCTTITTDIGTVTGAVGIQEFQKRVITTDLFEASIEIAKHRIQITCQLVISIWTTKRTNTNKMLDPMNIQASRRCDNTRNQSPRQRNVQRNRLTKKPSCANSPGITPDKLLFHKNRSWISKSLPNSVGIVPVNLFWSASQQKKEGRNERKGWENVSGLRWEWIDRAQKTYPTITPW